ncbi:MAG: galactosyltransferase-related protein, partial [Myxococcota bacterium]
MKISVLTLVRGRREQYAALRAGLRRQDQAPHELVVAYMQTAAHSGLDEVPYPVRSTFVDGDDLPLAAARNEAATTARGEGLIFLDVDCIPSRSLIASYRKALTEIDGCFMSEVLYLGPGDNVVHADTPALVDRQLDLRGHRHPARPPSLVGERWRREPDATQLWGLAFGMRRSTYLRVGGMDPGFKGYGGEETDFAMRLSRTPISTFWLNHARCYHQYHSMHSPPLQHFFGIIANARRFRSRWGDWCMTHWLDLFERAGLIRRSRGKIDVLRAPSAAEVDASRVPSS